MPVQLEIGRLGWFTFPAGALFYAGSARGPGGLRARLNHHLNPAKHPHWHIDWLRRAALVRGGWYAAVPGSLECTWSQALLLLPGAVAPIPGFGASDCANHCPAHLIAFPLPLDPPPVEDWLSATLKPGDIFSFVT
jgi:Uri superfamily endonuclease